MTEPGFGTATTADEVLDGVDLSGKVALVTGTSTGLGKETSRALASKGARVIMTARDEARGAAAVEQVKAAVPGADAELELVELGSLASVRAFAGRVLDRHPEIHILIANAGVMAAPLGRTDEGFELQFGTNHLGHFVLVNRLVPALLKGAPSRVVMVSSFGHQLGDIDFDDPNYQRRDYDKFAAYGQSKTANVLFAVELDRRLRSRGVRSYALHPGAIRTELGRHLDAGDLSAMRARAGRAPGTVARPKSVPAGAATSVWAATSPDLADRGGIYLEDCHIAETRSEMGLDGVRDYAVDGERARRLWTLSEELVAEQFPA
jgi:NAD(P)-dependent dehydrogenase (short-subunit alcohol dehydrogenase family)